MDISANEKYLVTSSGDSKIKIWKIFCKKNDYILTLFGHYSIIRCVKLTKN